MNKKISSIANDDQIKILDKEEHELQKRQIDRIDSSKIENKQCLQCRTFAIIKDDLKIIRQENYEKIASVQYDHEIAKRKISELQHNMEMIQEDNIRLREENKLLRATSNTHINNFVEIE